MSTMLKYQTMLVVSGQQYACIESYDSIHDRMRSTAFRAADSGQEMTWAAPLELTIMGPEGLPMRSAISPLAISMAYEIPASRQYDVVEGDA